MTKWCAGLVACAVVALSLTVMPANAERTDPSQVQTSGPGPSSGTDTSGGTTGGSTSSGPGSPLSGSDGGATPAIAVAPDSAPVTTDVGATSTTDPTSTTAADSTTSSDSNDKYGDDDDTPPPPPVDPAPLPPAPATTGPRFLVRARAAVLDEVIGRHHLIPIATVHDSGATDPADVERVMLIAGPENMSADEIDAAMDADPQILGCERDRSLALAELAGAATTASAGTISQTLATRTVTSFYGADAPSTYVSQPASTLINLPQVRASYTGAGVVAVIDTGVDATHPLLGSSVVEGYDFIRERAGAATDLLDLDQSTAAILEQSTAAILEQNQVVVVNQSTAAILEQSTAAILEGLPALPLAFGHGTMVAGLIHLTAPTATILPLKAFSADGTSTIANVVRAIYYAVDHGARVINMSFSVVDSSLELMKAINYATSHRVTCVASSGNLGIETVVYPAAYRNVIAVASTTNADTRSAFSNYGDADVTIAAPGDTVTTTYPGGHYASASGTSFSAALVSGAVSLMLQQTSTLTPRDAFANVIQADRIVPRLGYGRLDLQKALSKDHY
jgi:subtilisin family serine protease